MISRPQKQFNKPGTEICPFAVTSADLLFRRCESNKEYYATVDEPDKSYSINRHIFCSTGLDCEFTNKRAKNPFYLEGKKKCPDTKAIKNTRRLWPR